MTLRRSTRSTCCAVLASLGVLLSALAVATTAQADRTDRVTGVRAQASAIPAGVPGSETNPLPTPTSPGFSVLDTSCPGGNTCFWRLQNYQGEKFVYGNQWAGTWYYSAGGAFTNSTKNRFDNRAVLISDGSGSQCTPPGGNRPNPQSFDRFFIGSPGLSC